MSREKWLQRAVTLVVDTYAPERVIVFGSQATGKTDTRSDIDLLIVADSETPRGKRGDEVAPVLSTWPVKVDLLFYTPREASDALKNPYSIVSSAFAHGRILYGTA